MVSTPFVWIGTNIELYRNRGYYFSAKWHKLHTYYVPIEESELCYHLEMPRKVPSLIQSALRELGPAKLGLYALYQMGLHSGYYRWATRKAPDYAPGALSLDWLDLPACHTLIDLLGENGVVSVLARADEILSGKVRLFGARPVPLQLTVPRTLDHWTRYDHDLSVHNATAPVDIKFIWEPGRFGWAYTLGRAYHLSSDERYPQAFWSYTETFLDGNPPYLGPHWISAQEAALRLIALVFAGRVFSGSPHTTPKRLAQLANAISAHAARIPPTLIYARAQDNNHLLSEAAGLYTAGLALPEHPSAQRWRTLGWRWFNQGIQSQVDQEGAYGQHSANYQRLMLQLGLWMRKVARAQKRDFPDGTLHSLAAATRWLCDLLEPENGCVPNLGPNDGAYILPLTQHPFSDFRPALQAASRVFLGEPCVAPGAWDEMALWLVDEQDAKQKGASSTSRVTTETTTHTPHVIRLKKHPSWAYLRAAHVDSRPGHADQLHLDLWWRGLNVALDPGTYLYNASPPWDNALACTQVHNTLTVNEQEQMQRVGRFLYLQRAQAQVLEQAEDENDTWQRLVAQHDGYRRMGLVHRRAVTGYEAGRWVIEDRVLTSESGETGMVNSSIEVCLHWLLPDWSWEVEGGTGWESRLRLVSPHGIVTLLLKSGSQEGPAGHLPELQIARAGEPVYGSGAVAAVWGWSSPTYGDKIPALSVRWTVLSPAPIYLRSEWIFP